MTDKEMLSKIEDILVMALDHKLNENVCDLNSKHFEKESRFLKVFIKDISNYGFRENFSISFSLNRDKFDRYKRLKRDHDDFIEEFGE